MCVFMFFAGTKLLLWAQAAEGKPVSCSGLTDRRTQKDKFLQEISALPHYNHNKLMGEGFTHPVDKRIQWNKMFWAHIIFLDLFFQNFMIFFYLVWR